MTGQNIRWRRAQRRRDEYDRRAREDVIAAWGTSSVSSRIAAWEAEIDAAARAREQAAAFVAWRKRKKSI